MSDVPLAVVLLNAAGQSLFAGRVLLQWWASEKAGRTVVPRLFWHLSLVGSLCAVVYSGFRHDPVFMLASLPGCMIYARNLYLRRERRAGTLVPFALALVAFFVWSALQKPRIDSRLWAGIGLAGSVLWSSRWVVQWWISERTGRALLPRSFFLISLVASLLLSAYCIRSREWVMLLAYGLTPVPSLRNLILDRRASSSAAR